MKVQAALCLLFILLLSYRPIGGCTSCTGVSGSTTGYTEVTYQTSTAGVINPGRGATVLLITRSSAHVPLSVSTLSTYRTTEKANVVWRQWYLDDFTDSDISTAFLINIQEDFDVIRNSGYKVIIRFAYTDDQNAAVKDATPAQVLAHIAQLKPYLQANKDVILALQAGLIGVWGEWYYSTNFGNEGVLTDTDIQNRKDVVAALLNALPEERNILMRTPALKQQMTGSSSALSLHDYRDYTNNASRIGHHNDCFLASSTDFGTYTDTTVDYPYMEEDTKYVVMGGETCAVNHPRSHCTTAKSELAMFHWTYMNVLYNTEVYDDWKTEGCYDEILDNLGYRLRLTKAVFPDSVTSNSEACFLIDFTNDGYDTPADQRDVKVVLRSSTATYTSGHIAEFSNAEPWLPESGTISVTFTLHMNVPADDYEVLLQIGDQYLSGADYNVLLLNKGVPEVDTALNNLRHTIIVTAGSPTTSACTSFTSTASVPTSENPRCYSGCSEFDWPISLPDVTSSCTENLVTNGGFETLTAFNVLCVSHEYKNNYNIRSCHLVLKKNTTPEISFSINVSLDFANKFGHVIDRGKGRKNKKQNKPTGLYGDVNAETAALYYGSQALSVNCATETGFYQTIAITESGVTSLTASLWSNADSVTTAPSNTADYAVYADITFGDGTVEYGWMWNAPFDTTVSGWQKSTLDITHTKSISSVLLWGLCRNGAGTAFFDEMALFVSPATCT